MSCKGSVEAALALFGTEAAEPRLDRWVAAHRCFIVAATFALMRGWFAPVWVLGLLAALSLTGLSPLGRNLAIGAAVLVLAFLVWSYCLRRTVAARTGAIGQLNQELEARLAERTAELASANRDLEALSSSLSHDLKGSLGSLSITHELLARNNPSPEAQRQLDRARRATSRMGQLIDDLRSFSRAARGPVQRSAMDLTQLALDLAKVQEEAHPERKVVLEVEPGLHCDADPHLVQIMLENLLSNAWKFTRGREPAHVRVGKGPDDAFFVQDDGAGFDPATAGKLFHPFERLPHIEKFEGTGLGLSTVARIIARHGGKIWANSSPGNGATFHFTLGSRAR